MWWCSRITFDVCACVLCGEVRTHLHQYAAASPYWPFTFLTNFKISDFNKGYKSSLKMIWMMIETWWNVFKCFNMNILHSKDFEVFQCVHVAKHLQGGKIFREQGVRKTETHFLWIIFMCNFYRKPCSSGDNYWNAWKRSTTFAVTCVNFVTSLLVESLLSFWLSINERESHS